MKNYVSIFLTLIFVVLATSFVNAEEELSQWAIQEVTEAINEEIVPSQLRTQYTDNIKRYEYVLLALELLDSKNDLVKIEKKYPFTDINDHEYKDEILRAYNAGIVKGYGDGTFKPDNYISREEISSLLVNLIQRLEQQNIEPTYSYVYSDSAIISTWARSYIDYLVEQGIIEGTGVDNNNKLIIDPKGSTTREQAIVLLYRLALKSKLANTNDYIELQLTYEVDADDEGIVKETIVESSKFNEFSKIFGQDITTAIYELIEQQKFTVSIMDKDFIQLNYGDIGYITLTHNGYSTKMTVHEKNNNEILVKDFIMFAEILNEDNGVEDAILRDFNMFNENMNHTTNFLLRDSITYKSFASIEGMNDWFHFEISVSIK